MKLKQRLLAWLGAVLCMAYLLPNHYSPWLSVHQELATALAFAPIVMWAAWQLRRVPALAVAAAALAAVPLVQAASGQLFFVSDGWMAALYLIGFALVIHAGARCADDGSGSPPGLMASLLAPWAALLLAGLVSVNIQAYQWLMMGNGGIYVAELPPYGHPFGNLSQPNQLATLLLMAEAGVLFFWEAGKVRASIALLAALTLAFGLVMTGSRSVLLTLVWLLPAYALLRRRCNLRTSPAAVVLVTGFYLLCSFGWTRLNSALLLFVDANGAVQRIADLGVRKVFWVQMIDAIGRAPWAGYGWGQIGRAQTLTALDHPPTHEFFDSAHNLLMDLALFNGLPIAIVVTLVLVLWFGWQVRQCRDPLSFAALMAIGVVFSHAMVEYPIYYAYFLMPVGFWMGALSAVHPSPLASFNPTRWLLWARASVVTMSAGVLAMVVMVAIDYFPFEADWQLMQFQQRKIGNVEPTEPPPALLLTSLHAFMQFSRAQARPAMAADEIESMRMVSERYAYAASMFKYGLAQALNHQSAGAQQTLQRLCQMQTEAACKSARLEWAQLTQTRYPQLVETPFPSSITPLAKPAW